MAVRIHRPMKIVRGGKRSGFASGTYGRATRLPITAGKVVAVVVTKRPWLAEHVGLKLAWQTVKPIRVVVCSAVDDYYPDPIIAALPGIPVVIVPAPKHMVLGALRNLAMDHAAADSDDETICCTIDDDDLYGTRYFEGILDAWRKHSDALIVGVASWAVTTATVPPRDPPSYGAAAQGGVVAGVAGATISIPAAVWKQRALRYPDITIGEDVELQRVAVRRKAIVSAYFGEFVAVRYDHPEHAHVSPPPITMPKSEVFASEKRSVRRAGNGVRVRKETP